MVSPTNPHTYEFVHPMISINRDHSCYMMLGHPTSVMYIWKPIGGWCLLHGLLHSRCSSILRYIAGPASGTTWTIINQQIPANVVNCWKNFRISRHISVAAQQQPVTGNRQPARAKKTLSRCKYGLHSAKNSCMSAVQFSWCIAVCIYIYHIYISYQILYL